MGEISYPRTVGSTEQVRLVSQVEDKVEALLNSVDPSASDIASILALVNRIDFDRLPQTSKDKLLRLLRKLQQRVATAQFNQSNAHTPVAKDAIQGVNNEMIRLALSFHEIDKNLPLHERLNQTEVFDFKLLLESKELTFYTTSDGMMLVVNHDVSSPEFADAAQISSLSVKAINQAKPEIQQKLVESSEANKTVVFGVGNTQGTISGANIALNNQTKQDSLHRLQNALRYRVMGWNHEQKKFSNIETLGISRAENFFGRRFQPSNIEGVDFLDPLGFGKVSLKGPFLDRNLNSLKIEYQEAAIKSISKHIERNRAVDVHIIDITGLNDDVFCAMQEALKNSMIQIKYIR